MLLCHIFPAFEYNVKFSGNIFLVSKTLSSVLVSISVLMPGRFFRKDALAIYTNSLAKYILPPSIIFRSFLAHAFENRRRWRHDGSNFPYLRATGFTSATDEPLQCARTERQKRSILQLRRFFCTCRISAVFCSTSVPSSVSRSVDKYSGT